MIRASDLVVGQFYFEVTFNNAARSRPVILSFEYLGKDIHGFASSGYFFRFLPGFESGDQDPETSFEKTPFVFGGDDIGSLCDLAGLIDELKTLLPEIPFEGRQQ